MRFVETVMVLLITVPLSINLVNGRVRDYPGPIERLMAGLSSQNGHCAGVNRVGLLLGAEAYVRISTLWLTAISACREGITVFHPGNVLILRSIRTKRKVIEESQCADPDHHHLPTYTAQFGFAPE